VLFRSHWTTLGFFGRFNYNFKEKYLFEAVVRRDGSSRYPDSSVSEGASKWGTFPSFSGGWNIAKEDFFSSMTHYLSEFKLRGSWGELGNMRGKSYQYVSTIDYNAAYSYIMNGQQISAFKTPSMIAYNTWEKNRTLDFGIDVASFNNRLTGSFDWYQKDIIGLITQGVALPATLGATSPETNNADIRNTGFELTLSWKDRFNVKGKPFSYNVYATLSDYQGEVMKYSNPKGLIGKWDWYPNFIPNFYEGAKMGEIWGYTTDHIMVDATEAAQVQASGSQSKIGGNWTQGDMKYKDLNNDGAIDDGSLTLDDRGDLSVIGNNTPRYNYGFGLNAEWNGFDISVLFQGVGKRNVWLSGVEAWGMGGGQWQSNAWENTLDCWRNDGSNMNPYFPKFYWEDWGNKNMKVQTKYLDNAAYCRLKNIQIGYTIPEQITKKAAMNKVRVYFSGDNLLTFSKINENFDPEVPSKNVYPLSKTVSVGVNVTF